MLRKNGFTQHHFSKDINKKLGIVKSGAGFTLVELLVVISIVSILTVIGMGAYGNILRNSRDAKRQTDLRLIQSALEKYHSDLGYYPCMRMNVPAGGGDPIPPGLLAYQCNNAFELATSTQLTSETGRPALSGTEIIKSYLDNIPQSPTGNYIYSSSPSFCDNTSEANKCTRYCLYVNLEVSTSQPVNNCTNASFNLAIPSAD